MKKISRIRWLTTLMGLVVLMFTCAGCGQTAAQSNVPKPMLLSRGYAFMNPW